MSRAERGQTETDESSGERFAGRAMRRVEDYDILTGRAEFIHDKKPADALHMALARSVHPHATIVDIDTSEAEAHPDCELVLTGEDLKRNYNPMPTGLEGFTEYSLAPDVVRFVGEPVVAVVATDRYVAEDIIDLVSVEYERLDHVVEAMEAREDETVIHSEVGTNVPDSERFVYGDPESAFADADNVVEGTYSWGRISGVPLETAGVLARYDPGEDVFDIDCNLQLHTHVNDQVYETLGYPEDKVRISVPADVGGSYGTKLGIHRYVCLAAIASHQLDGRPVVFDEDRIENLQGGDMHSTERDYEMKLAFDDDGTIRGMDMWFVDDFGAYPRRAVNQVLRQLSVLSDAYEIENVIYEYELAVTNKTSQTAYRGFGVPAHFFAIEMIVDEAAREIEMDPTEFRRRNLIPPEKLPYKLPSNNVYDSGDYPAALEQIRSIVNERERCDGGLLDPDIIAAQKAKGKYRGVRCGVHLEPGVGGRDWIDRQQHDRDALKERSREAVQELPEHLSAELSEEGTVEAFLAADSSGQGHRTIVAQLLADVLEIPPSDIAVSYLNSAESPKNYGSAGSRMAAMLTGAADGLGAKLKANLRSLAASEWGVDETEVTYRNGTVRHVGGTEEMGLADLGALDDDRTSAAFEYDHPATTLPEFDDALREKLPLYPTVSYAANAPIVEVDVKTGEVEILRLYSLRDCGTQINPMIVEGQVLGGLVQGVGAALSEEFGYGDNGQPQAVTLFDYVVPSVENAPEIVLSHEETPSPFTPKGVKGTGEGGMTDGPASIAASINAALEDFDIVVDQIPATGHRIRKWIRESDTTPE